MRTQLKPLLLAAGLAWALVLGLPAVPAAAETATAPAASSETGHAVAPSADAGGAAGQGEHTEGLPQFNTSTFPSQIFWLAIAFITLLYLLSRKALPRVAEILEARQDRIATDLDRAASLRNEAEEALQRYEEVLADAHARAHRQVQEVQDRVAADIARQQAKLDTELAAKLRDAEKRIGAAKQSALAQVAEVAAEVVQAASERLAGISLSPDEAKAAVGRTLEEAR